MKKTAILLVALAISGCMNLQYDAKEIKYMTTGWQSIHTALEVGEIKYSPPTGIGQRSISMTGGLIVLFTDVSRDIDINVSDLVRTEIDRAINERTIKPNKPTKARTINADVFYLKMDQLGSVTTTIRYCLLEDGKELYRAKITSECANNPFTSDRHAPSECQLIANGIHKNFNTLIEQETVRNILVGENK